MTVDIKKIGELLKKKREEHKFSLREVEASTSIRLQYLQAIEEGRGEGFFSTMYMYGFIRQYASFLDLNEEQLTGEFPEVFSPGQLKHEFSYGIGTLEARKTFGQKKGWAAQFTVVGAIAVSIAIVWQMAKWIGWV